MLAKQIKIFKNYFFMKNNIKNFEFEKDENNNPKNIFHCQFFKVGTEANIASNAILVGYGQAFCSIKEKELKDYKECCTKHEGDKPNNYQHCQAYLERLGNMNDKNRLELRNLKLMKESVVSAGKSTKVAAIAAWAAVITVIITGLGVYFTYIQPEREKIKSDEIETKNNIVSFYRTIAANQTAFIDNSNIIHDFASTTTFYNLPFNYLANDIPTTIQDELQRKIGMINYRYLTYYIEQTKILNESINNLKTGLMYEGLNSNNFTELRQSYIDLMSYLSEDSLEKTKFNYLTDTECLLHILRESFAYIRDPRNELAECRNESLNRIYYQYGYLEIDTPEWMKSKFIEALKERDINAWWIN